MKLKAFHFAILAAAVIPGLGHSVHASETGAKGPQSSGNEVYHDDYITRVEIPEPLVFDLVRQLGAKAGELEINTLMQIERSLRPGDLQFAPEIEYAIFDDFALELELPFQGSSLESVKGAAQLTFGTLGKRGQIIHGMQLLYERSVESREANLLGVYIFGHRLPGKLSYLAMVGPSQNRRADGSTAYTGIFNFSLFYNSSREVDLGLELNWIGPHDEFRMVRLMPQLHLVFPGEWKVQAGAGILSQAGTVEMTSAFRIIKEFN